MGTRRQSGTLALDSPQVRSSQKSHCPICTPNWDFKVLYECVKEFRLIGGHHLFQFLVLDSSHLLNGLNCWWEDLNWTNLTLNSSPFQKRHEFQEITPFQIFQDLRKTCWVPLFDVHANSLRLSPSSKLIDSMFHFSQCSGYDAVRQLRDYAAHSWWSMMWCSILLKDSSQPIDYVETCKRYGFSFRETTHLFDERIHASILDRGSSSEFVIFLSWSCPITGETHQNC